MCCYNHHCNLNSTTLTTSDFFNGSGLLLPCLAPLSLKEMAHLILWRINRTALFVVNKEAERVRRRRSERLGLQNPENSSGGRLQSSSCCQLLYNSLKTLFDWFQDGSAVSSKWRWAEEKNPFT